MEQARVRIFPWVLLTPRANGCGVLMITWANYREDEWNSLLKIMVLLCVCHMHTDNCTLTGDDCAAGVSLLYNAVFICRHHQKLLWGISLGHYRALVCVERRAHVRDPEVNPGDCKRDRD